MARSTTLKTKDALALYRQAYDSVRAAGFAWEAEWQRQRVFETFTERDFLRESAWVVLCSGFREASVRRVFDYISLCFCDWESATEITRNQRACIETAASAFANQRKLGAIASIASVVDEHGFGLVKAELFKDPINKLQVFPFIGPITSWHLAKNLGFNVAKNDRHLARLATAHGFADAHDLCELISNATCEPQKVVDIVLWRFATLSGYQGA
jgi:hypothetical protein